jgi:hypothetical protein
MEGPRKRQQCRVSTLCSPPVIVLTVAYRIILCNKSSPFPFQIDPAHIRGDLAALQARLKPYIIVYQGQPHQTALNLWTHVFSTVAILVCSENHRASLEDALEVLPRNQHPSSVASMDRVRAVVTTFFKQHQPSLAKDGRAVKLVHRLHFHYEPPKIVGLPPNPDHAIGTRYTLLRGFGDAGEMVFEQEMLRACHAFRQDHVLKEIVRKRRCLVAASVARLLTWLITTDSSPSLRRIR